MMSGVMGQNLAESGPYKGRNEWITDQGLNALFLVVLSIKHTLLLILLTKVPPQNIQWHSPCHGGNDIMLFALIIVSI